MDGEPGICNCTAPPPSSECPSKAALLSEYQSPEEPGSIPCDAFDDSTGLFSFKYLLIPAPFEEPVHIVDSPSGLKFQLTLDKGESCKTAFIKILGFPCGNPSNEEFTVYVGPDRAGGKMSGNFKIENACAFTNVPDAQGNDTCQCDPYFFDKHNSKSITGRFREEEPLTTPLTIALSICNYNDPAENDNEEMIVPIKVTTTPNCN